MTIDWQRELTIAVRVGIVVLAVLAVESAIVGFGAQLLWLAGRV